MQGEITGMQYNFQDSSYLPNNNARLKKIVIALGVIALILTVAIGIFTLRASGTSSPTDPNPTDSNANVTPTVEETLINTQDLDRQKEYIKKKYEEQGQSAPVEYQYKFQYKLDPALQSQGFSIVKPAYAANECNINTAPLGMNMYILDSRLNKDQARDVADLFTMEGEPETLSTGTAFPMYFYHDPTSGSFLSVLSGSGAYMFNAPIVSGAAADAAAVKRTADLAMNDYVYSIAYNDPIDFKLQSTAKRGSQFVFTYTKKWGEIPLVDQSSIVDAQAGSLCTIAESKISNYTEVVVAEDARLAKVNYQHRTVKSITQMTRIKLAEALQEFEAGPPIDPIVSPPGKVVTGTVTITDAVVVYYDYGIEIPQHAYIPFYLTRGTVRATDGTDVVVHTLYPAMTKYALSQAGIVAARIRTNDAAAVGRNTSQQQGTFGIQALEPTDSPRSGKLTPAGGCPAQRIDYSQLNCLDATGYSICKAASILTSSNPDPLQVCESGACQGKSGVVEYAAGSNPCQLFLQQNGIAVPADGIPIRNSPPREPGRATCFFNACPS